MPTADPIPSTPEDLVARSASRLLASEEALLQGDLSAAAPLAYEALRAALSAAMGRHGLPFSESSSLLGDAERLGRTAKLGCMATKIAPLLCLGLDRRDAPQDPARLTRLLPAAYEVTRNLQALAGSAQPEGAARKSEP